MKTKLISVVYLGYTAMDRRFSNAMLPWLLKEIRTTGVKDKLSIVIEDGYLKAFNGNFEPVIVHRLVDIIRASQVPGRPEELFYIMYNEKEGLLNCYLFRASSIHEVTDLFSQMREPSPGAASPKGSTGSLTNGAVTRNIGFCNQTSAEHLPWNSPAVSLPGNCNSNLTSESAQLVRSISNASALTSLSADLSPSDSHFFEVLYIGKVRISQRKVPESLIDDALTKFAQHEAEKAMKRRHSLLSSTGTSLYSNTSQENLTEDKKESQKITALSPSTTPLEPDKAWKSTLIKQTDTKEIEDEFDSFTKERIETNRLVITESSLKCTETNLGNKQKGEMNLGKQNLGTVEEERNDIKTNILETANSISKFCENASKFEFSEETIKNPNPFLTKDVKLVTGDNIEKHDVSEKENKHFESNKENLNKLLNITAKNESKMNFDEIRRKPGGEVGNDKAMPENKPFLRDRSASIGTISNKTPIAQLIGEQNRTMLFQVARSELRLISPDRKQILLHRAFKDVASCVLGRTNKDHFGFVCRETNDSYACYVFKCESDSVACEVVNAIRQAFVAHAEFLKKSRDKSPNMTCEHCPMLWYHRLCHDVDGMNDKKTHAFILRRIEQLPDDEQDLIITKYQGGTNHMYETSEHNAFLMMLLRAHCEAKQQRHVHDTAENRSEFLNQYLGGSTIFMKAKRSLSSGFDHLLKRRASRDDLPNPSLMKKEVSPLPTPVEGEPSELAPPEARSKSLSPAVISQDNAESPKHTMTPTLEEEEEAEEVGTPVNSPMMDIFLKVSDNRPSPAESGAEPDATWRQAIYQKVMHPTEGQEGDLSANLLGKPSAPKGKRSREELRELWKMAIDQTILLVRMEKENARLKEREESSAVRRIKLEYSELGACDPGVTLMWDSLLRRDPSQPHARVDKHMLTQAVIQGVPRVSRGAVWYFLAAQASLRAPPPDTATHPHYHTPYRTLLAGLTKHQHAILIDLGRTFPKHSYFASALGPGQLALYNILKAYSLLDPDVGYCQGLSFVAGVLLLHMEEAEAFILLRHLMFRRGLRKQYLPDMSALQVQLYQLSRLLRDQEPELHAKLEELDISPALYAAPWMLTLFTSQFPLGFVVRVFDLIFLESLDVIFAISLAILSAHKDGLMMCESCEEAAEYLKHKIPDMTPQTYHKIMKKVHNLDISRQLSDYAVEYAVLREEMPRVASLTEENKLLANEKNRLSEELDSAMDTITSYQKNQARLETINKSLEQQLTLLSRYISSTRLEMPQEVKKIVHTHSKRLSFSSKLFATKFSTSEDEEKKFKSGMSTPNLFAKMNEQKESPERERKHFIMKKSLSVHSGLIAKPLKILEEENEKGGFFANTHEQIRQERLFEKKLKQHFDENLKKLDEKLTPQDDNRKSDEKSPRDDETKKLNEKLSFKDEFRKLDEKSPRDEIKKLEKLSPKSYLDDLNVFQSRKSMSLNLSPSKDGGKDSGFVTPLSPDKKNDSSSTISHPLSDCDVEIKFDGQSTKLKQIRPLKSSLVNKNA